VRRFVVSVAVVALLGAWTVGVADANRDRTVRVIGSEQFVPNAKVMATFRFAPGPLSVKSGDTVRWVSYTPEDPHTISVVAQADLPTSVAQVFGCAVCSIILAGHFPNGFNNPPVPVLNVGSPGLDAVGDSLLLAPGGSVSAVISAPAGSTLHYLCAIHPWMQGTISVH
jgi:plastocyanin